jgi:hypothetical protein
MYKQSNADPHQIVQREFDEDNNAQRVVIVGGEIPAISSQNVQEVRIERIEVPQIIVQKEVQIVEVEKQVIVKEIQIVEVPRFVDKIVEVKRNIIVEKIVEVIKEVPVIQTEVQVIEKPIIIKETQVVQIKEISNLVKVFMAVNSLATLILLVKLIIK